MTFAERLEAIGGPTESEEMENWKVLDRGGADWACRKVAKCDAKARKVMDEAQAHRDAIDALETEELRSIQRDRSYFEARLGEYHRMVLAEDPEGPKTIHLQGGDLVARKLPDGVQIIDEAAVLEWAKGDGMAYVTVIPVSYRLDKMALKEAVLKGGEIIPGVTPVEGEVRYNVVTSQEVGG
jgi:phage host-nuclease inhibitor protein Gam